MSNPIDILKRIAFGLDFLGRDSRKVSAYTNGARTLKKLGGDLPRMYAAGELSGLRGIGNSIINLVGLALEDKPVPALVQLEQEIPDGIWDLRGIRGLGAKKLNQVHAELAIGSIAELEYACNENRLIDLKGFGRRESPRHHQRRCGLQAEAQEVGRDSTSVTSSGAKRLPRTLKTP